MKKIIFVYFILIGLFSFNTLFAENIHFLDYRYILNESIAGKKAQTELKKKLDKNIKTIQNKEKSIRDEEQKIIQQKKIISPEEYKKKINDLRKKVSTLQSERNKVLNSVANERAKAKKKLLENLNPILNDYMTKNNIKIILDKKNLIRADNRRNIESKN